MNENQTFPKAYHYDEEPCHKMIVKQMKQALAYDPTKEYATWKQEIREKFLELSGMNLIEANGDCDPELNIEHTLEKDGYTEIRFTFQSEIGYRVPCYLLIPDTGKASYPVAITLQGHSTGFHNSVGIARYEQDLAYRPRGQFGIQAVQHGYAALCIEQRGMGERRPRALEADSYRTCNYTAMQAFQLGRTLLAERAWDVHKAIDLLAATFEKCDTEKVLITGNSGGGTASFYSACYDERIKLCAPSCSFCPYGPSIMDMYHCPCNYIPGCYQWFDMQDLACLIAPRNLSVIAGVKDNIFPIEGVKAGYATVEKIYAAAGAPDACSMTVTPEKHWWCEDIVWGEIDRVTGALGWKN
ncbi:MAG: acetylxylan esterase [Clostridia bacterium]|nr:acetylxylan esterase [Clostridia bacterium]